MNCNQMWLNLLVDVYQCDDQFFFVGAKCKKQFGYESYKASGIFWNFLPKSKGFGLGSPSLEGPTPTSHQRITGLQIFLITYIYLIIM
jgi:hypothetical protein